MAGNELIKKRNGDETRNDKTFKQLYMNLKPFKLAFLENPLLLHMRLHRQQGLFTCPGDISVPFEENLKGMDGWQNKDAIVKLVCKIEDGDQLNEALERLSRMNINRETLFHGLDGFAQSMKYRLSFYKKLAGWRTGSRQKGP